MERGTFDIWQVMRVKIKISDFWENRKSGISEVKMKVIVRRNLLAAYSTVHIKTRGLLQYFHYIAICTYIYLLENQKLRHQHPITIETCTVMPFSFIYFCQRCQISRYSTHYTPFEKPENAYNTIHYHRVICRLHITPRQIHSFSFLQKMPQYPNTKWELCIFCTTQ